MFGWSIAKPTEAVLPRWAMKKLFKFVLKKKLGKFILGDIDLDQLDVQLGQGTIQLSDLALNVDYLNDKFGALASVIIKEGSIGSLSVKMPWKVKGFQVEVDELELVLAPCLKNDSKAGAESSSFSEDSDHHMHSKLRKPGHNMVDSVAKSSSNDVHEGVKTIAKMVKLFLTSFHVKVKKLIVAFEPYLEKDEKKAECHKTLVLRISETECGTGVSDDANSNSTRVESFLGISQLTNFVKFEGAVLELLQVDDVCHQACSPCVVASDLVELFSEHYSSNATTPIVTGKKGGFSGNLKLSIPWSNGSLDIRKVDADVCIDPIELRFQPSTIKWFLLSWEIFKNLDDHGGSNMHFKSMDSVYLDSAAHFHSSASVPAMVATDNLVPVRGSVPSALPSSTGQESASEDMLPGSHLIADWVPSSVKEVENDEIRELDLGASVEQFFECFDEMRNSRSALGCSGMWNWTCSVFSAITAASSLASGSLHIPSEQQHVQTNLKATLDGFSIMLSFQDEQCEDLCEPKGEHNSIGSNVHYLGAECKDISVVLQVCPQETRFEATLEYIEVADYSCCENDVMNLCLCEHGSEGNSQTLLIQHLQAEVQGALPPFASSAEDPDPDELSLPVASDFPFGNATKFKLLGTSGVTRFQFTVNSSSSDKSLTGSTSFLLQLPKFVFWVNLWSINTGLDLLKDVGKSVDLNSRRNGLLSGNEKHGSSHGNAKKGSAHGAAALSSTKSWQGNILIPNARVIICFPFESGKNIGDYSSWDQFIAIDFSSSRALEKGKLWGTTPALDTGSGKKYTSRATHSLHLNVGDLKIFLINPSGKNDVGIFAKPRQNFCAQNILSACSGAGCLSTVIMLWQDSHVTDPWMAERAKSLAGSGETESRKKFVVNDCEYATVTAVKDQGDLHSQTRDEMIFSSVFSLHIHLFPVTINLGSSQYGNLRCLLDQMISGLLGGEGSVGEVSSVSQTSIRVECESVEISIKPDIKEDVKSSLQSELPGSWDCLKLKIRKFDMLSISNIGGIKDANIFWLAHGEGKLWGSVTGVPDQEFLLISCSNSTGKRGDGGGSNALSSGLAGSDIIHMWDPRSFHSFTSVTVRCGTIVAVGGRLDWLDTISSFFSHPSPEVERAGDDCLPKGDLNAACGTSFILKLIDIGLSYEPHLNPLVRIDSSSLYFKEEMSEPYIACLLAASSLTLSSRTMGDSMENDYKIGMQDLGLLLCPVYENVTGTYSVEYLREMGYVKIAREALIEAILRTNCENGLLWELECSKSHIYVETCHDTTFGLMRLAAQLQQLFAPDLEESIVHLQTRWNNVHQARERSEFNDEAKTSNHDCAPSSSQSQASSVDTNFNAIGLMDEICEDAFHLDGSQVGQFDSNGSQVHVSLDESILGEACGLSFETPDNFADDQSVDGLMHLIGVESSETSLLQNGYFPEFMEGYCLSELRPLSELTLGRQLSPEILKCRSKNFGDGDLGKGGGGWYGNASVSIVENHISEGSGEASVNQFLEDKVPSIDCAMSEDFGKATGRILLKNINVSWRMYTGSDWHAYKKNGEPSRSIHGRDETACLELMLSGLQFQYDFYPLRGICSSKLSLSVQDFYLYDVSKNAPWKLVLGHYHSKDHPRESSSKAFRLNLEAVRPDLLTPLEEYRLHIAFLPMLLHLHQSQLDFLISFFGAKSLSSDLPSDHQQNSDGANLSATKSNTVAGHTIVDEALLPYFQKFDIWPIILRVDYSPCHIDLAALRGGKYVELVNLVPWKGVELQLKHVHAVGVYGWGSVCETILGEWLEDISHNQIHKVLRGLPPVRSLVAVGAGAAKLVSLPVESYRKDQRVLKGMQRGTIAFLKSISLEAVGLGVHLAAGAHNILLQAECILTSIPPHVSRRVKDKSKPNVRCNQPKDARQGIQQACESLSDGLGKSASALVQTPLKKYQRGASAGSALATAMRAVPTAAIAPVSACASAAHCALLGLRNSLDPEHKKESMEKYMGPT